MSSRRVKKGPGRRPRAGHCAVGGWYDTPQIAGEVAFVASYTNGRWHEVMQIPGLASLDTGKHSKVSSVLCTAPGSCAAGGNYLTTAGSATWRVTRALRLAMMHLTAADPVVLLRQCRGLIQG